MLNKKYRKGAGSSRQWSLIVIVVLLALWLAPAGNAQSAGSEKLNWPANFDQAKIWLKNQVYHDRTEIGTFYCGCPWRWVGRSAGRTDLDRCGYSIRAQEIRAKRIEWEHVVPASMMGRQLQCWQEGGRRNCRSQSALFNIMEADMHNLTPSVGEINADRSNYRFGILPDTPYRYGQCDFKVDFPNRVAEPKDAVKGKIARKYFYIHDRYDLPLSSSQEQLLMAWDRQFPVSDWERERDRRIAETQGNHNPFVTGEKSWTRGYRPSGQGLVDHQRAAQELSDRPIVGNTNSRIYHLPQGCPSYSRVGQSNRKEFATEQDAQAAGFRKAGNCR